MWSEISWTCKKLLETSYPVGVSPDENKNGYAFAELVQRLEDRSLSLIIREAGNEEQKSFSDFKGRGDIWKLESVVKGMTIKNKRKFDRLSTWIDYLDERAKCPLLLVPYYLIGSIDTIANDGFFCNIARCLLIGANLLTTLWTYAVMASVYIRKQTP